MSDLLESLNSEQSQAVSHLTGPALVVAGPGSGKTRVLTYRIANLIHNHRVNENEILCVTFTNKAAAEIKERVQKLLDGNKILTWSGTFHSICARILRKDGYHIGIPISFVIYDTDDQIDLIKEISKNFGIDPKQVKPYSALATISNAKSELIAPEAYERYAHGFFQKTVSKIYFEYQRLLKKNNALDFDDILVETVNLFKQEPAVLDKYTSMFKYILIDEYQDTNKAQYVLTKMLASQHQNLFVVGDMSQAIYSFRGADYRNILNFQNDYPGAAVYNLARNYRSTQNILDAATSLITNNATHIPLELWTDSGTGEKVTIYCGGSDTEEATFVISEINNFISNGNDFKDIAILYRTNAQSRNIEEFLIRSSIPYKIIGGLRFYSRKEIKDVIAFLRVVKNPKDSVSWKRIINTPPRGIGQKGMQALADADWNLDLVEATSKLPFKKWIKDCETMSTLELMTDILEVTGYLKWLNDGSDDGKDRIENINELKSVSAQFLDVGEFLENVALIESSETPKSKKKSMTEDKDDVVSLMTVHSSKGLEFALVFVIGMEEGLFPHSQSMENTDELEEERRLCYVAITRAKNKLILTHARSRLSYGTYQNNIPSRFLAELPKNVIMQLGTGSAHFRPKSYNFDDEFLEDEINRSNFTW